MSCKFHVIRLILKNRMGIPSSSSNWILVSCQLHSVTSGQSNSGHKQIHISKHQTQIFEELVPLILPLLKEHIKLGHAGIADHSV